MSTNTLKIHNFGGIIIGVPKIWTVDTEMYTEPDGR